MGPPGGSPKAPPPPPPSFSRGKTVGAQLRKAEFQQASLPVGISTEPAFLRDFEIASSSHDVMSSRHDRGSGALDLFFSAAFKETMIHLVVSELNLNAQHPLRRAPVFSDTTDFAIDKVMVLGARNNHKRLLSPSAETIHATSKKWQETADKVVCESWDCWGSSHSIASARVQVALAQCVRRDRAIFASLPVNPPCMTVCQKTGGADGIHVLILLRRKISTMGRRGIPSIWYLPTNTPTQDGDCYPRKRRRL